MSETTCLACGHGDPHDYFRPTMQCRSCICREEDRTIAALRAEVERAKELLEARDATISYMFCQRERLEDTISKVLADSELGRNLRYIHSHGSQSNWSDVWFVKDIFLNARARECADTLRDREKTTS